MNRRGGRKTDARSQKRTTGAGGGEPTSHDQRPREDERAHPSDSPPGTRDLGRRNQGSGSREARERLCRSGGGVRLWALAGAFVKARKKKRAASCPPKRRGRVAPQRRAAPAGRPRARPRKRRRAELSHQADSLVRPPAPREPNGEPLSQRIASGKPAAESRRSRAERPRWSGRRSAVRSENGCD